MKTCGDCKFCMDTNSPDWRECVCSKKDLLVLSTDTACEEDFEEPVFSFLEEENIPERNCDIENFTEFDIEDIPFE